MKQFLLASVVALSASSAFAACGEDTCGTGCKKDEITELYDQLAKKTAKIDKDCEEQSNEIKDVLKEVKQTVDECNRRLTAALTKYPTLAQELCLKGSLNVNLYVDTDEESAR